MTPLPTPKEVAAAAVAHHPSITDEQREPIAQLIERVIVMRDRAICDSLQQELGGYQKNLGALRKAIEAMLYPQG